MYKESHRHRSQGGLIMSEMFTKCNGFIVSGDPLVYADSATMTGQGTVSEPFGVKSTDLFVQEPLYTGVSGNSAYIGWNNETVLYSATATPSQIIKNQVSAFQLSESIANFDRIRLNFIHSYGYGTYQFCNSVEITVNPSYTGQDGIADIWKFNSFYDENKFTLSESTLTISGDGRYKISSNGTVAADLTARGAALQSVIGINRKV